MNAPKCCIRVSFTFVRDKVKTMCACTRQTTVCQFVCETKVDKNNSVWDNSKIRCARLFFSCASLSCTRFFCAVQFRDLLHRLRYFSRKMCMNWTIWVSIQSHLDPLSDGLTLNAWRIQCVTQIRDDGKNRHFSSWRWASRIVPDPVWAKNWP